MPTRLPASFCQFDQCLTIKGWALQTPLQRHSTHKVYTAIHCTRTNFQCLSAEQMMHALFCTSWPHQMLWDALLPHGYGSTNFYNWDDLCLSPIPICPLRHLEKDTSFAQALYQGCLSKQCTCCVNPSLTHGCLTPFLFLL